MHVGEFHCSSIIGGLVIPQEGGQESGDKGELMRSCSRDTRTKVQPRAPYFFLFIPRISSSSFTEKCFGDTRTKVQPSSPSIKVPLLMTREQKGQPHLGFLSPPLHP